MYDCIIVGAGISGLSAARMLAQRNANILVIEQAAQVGGALQSEETPDGFVLEHGTQTVSSDNTALWQHFDALGIGSEREIARRQGVTMLHHGQLERLTMSPLALLRSPLLPPGARLRLLAEPLLPASATDDESIATFFSRRLGPQFTRAVIDPFVAGVYGGNPHELSMRAVFPSLWNLEQRHGSMLGGIIAKTTAAVRNSKNGSAPPRTPRETFSFRRGLATWPRAIARQLGPQRVRLNTRAVAVQPASQSWYVTVEHNGQHETLHTTNLILSVPATIAAALVGHLEPVAARMLTSIAYPPMAILHLGYRRSDVQHPLDSMGMLCPTHEERPLLGALWMSTIFDGRAPGDSVLITTFVGGARRPELAAHDDSTLLELAHRQQVELIGARNEPRLARVYRWSRSVPQYDASQQARIEACNRLEARWPGLYLLSNYRNGFSAEACWKQAEHLASHLVLRKAAHEPASSTVPTDETEAATRAERTAEA